MLFYIFKIAEKLHISRAIYEILHLFYHRKINYDDAQIYKSRELLTSYSPDSDNTCILHEPNLIVKNPEYDLQIIVPAYNVSQYIEECIESVLSQYTKYKVLVIIVNDGSTDETRAILKRYENEPNIQIIDQDNKGFSGARNTALNRINARYILFLDSDDLLMPGAINSLLDAAYNQEPADVIGGGYIVFRENRIIKTQRCANNLTSKWFGNMTGVAWGKIYRADLFEHYSFPQGYWFEDTLISMIIYPNAHSFKTIDKIVYKYRRNYSGITFSSKKKYKSIDSFWITERLFKDYKIINLPIDDQFKLFMLEQIKINYRRVIHLNNEDVSIAIFILSINLYESIINKEDVELNSIPIVKAMTERDYGAFRLACMF